jgi:GT2 family glycosyltransferase
MSHQQPTVCFVIPTRDRSAELERTLSAIGRLPVAGEVLVIDNGSATPVLAPGSLPNGLPVRLECLPFNEGASARNRVIDWTDADWIVMLDDDSHPTDARFLDALADAPDTAFAISADIFLPNAGTREMGGLPEVFIGCGVAFRREAFEELGGYDASFGYYAEEYDLAARILLAGGSVLFDPRFRVDHFKVAAGRDMNVIVERLVRNNGWVMQRYAPESERRAQLREIRRRCRFIAGREDARYGLGRGLVELRRTINAQRRRPMPAALFDRFTGVAAARAALQRAYANDRFATACVIDPGKNAWCVERALDELGVARAAESDADALVIGTMSPGPMLDAAARRSESARRVIAPWTIADSVLSAGRAGAALAG